MLSMTGLTGRHCHSDKGEDSQAVYVAVKEHITVNSASRKEPRNKGLNLW